MEYLPLLSAIGKLVALILVYTLWRLRSNTQRNYKRSEAPEPWGAMPLMGHLHLLKGPTPPFKTLGAMADKHGPVFAIWLGMRRAFVVSSWEAVKECFNTNDRVFMTRPPSAAAKYMGYNYALFGLAPYGPYWRDMRKIAALELLSNRRLELLKRVRSSEVGTCIKELHSLCEKNGSGSRSTVVDMNQWFGHATLNVLVQMIAGKRYGGVGDDRESQRFRRAMREFMYLTGAFVLSDVIPYIEWMDLQGHVRSMKRNAEELEYFMGSWLEEHKKRRREGVVKEGGDFIDVMLSSFDADALVSGHKSETIIKATALNLILAGTDTTSVTLTWALSLLLNHTEALKTVQEELDIHVGRERWVEEADIKNLVYLQAVIKETYRLYPGGPLNVPREAMEACSIAGYYVPKGTRLIVNIWKLHRDPRVWADPNEFRPERFLTSHAELDVRGQHFEYIPFSSGRRACPGISLGSQMSSFTLACVLQGFNFATPMNAKVDMTEGIGLSLPKATPLEVILTPRLPSNLYQQGCC
ncbi:hypothetical protein L1049_003610 [Liquidambar formosana]|uniref:Cytochrome P450 n=1 Tax=Liquidambar formosana TaxID=63359 RepID=A0AAP0RM22_LIQFO